MNLDQQLQPLITENKARQIEGEVRFLTGYSDASWKHDDPNQGGGWGAWVRDSRHRVLMSGPCPPWVSNSSDCELVAVANAALFSIRKMDRSANILVIKTDSQDVCRWFGFRRGSRPPSKREAQEVLVKVLTEARARDLKVIVKWVKGHQGTGTTPGYLNTQADLMARQGRISRVKTIKSTPIRPHRKPL